jgi:tetratricopeptide (TPR) repeat protein
MLIRGYSLLLLILSLPAICAQAQVTQEPQRLESGKPIERDIAGGESHTYRLELAAGQFLRVLVEQKGVDVALTLAGPDGTQIIESDLTDTLGTREPLSYETAATGDYRLVVRANGVAALRGAYQVWLDLKGAANEQDRKRIAAEALLIEAARMARGKDFQQSIEKQQQALGLWREIGDRECEGDTLRSIGRNYGNLSRYDKVVENDFQVLAIRRALKDRRGEASDLGVAYERVSRFDSSLDYFVKALAINGAQESARGRSQHQLDRMGQLPARPI